MEQRGCGIENLIMFLPFFTCSWWYFMFPQFRYFPPHIPHMHMDGLCRLFSFFSLHSCEVYVNAHNFDKSPCYCIYRHWNAAATSMYLFLWFVFFFLRIFVIDLEFENWNVCILVSLFLHVQYIVSGNCIRSPLLNWIHDRSGELEGHFFFSSNLAHAASKSIIHWCLISWYDTRRLKHRKIID